MRDYRPPRFYKYTGPTPPFERRRRHASPRNAHWLSNALALIVLGFVFAITLGRIFGL